MSKRMFLLEDSPSKTLLKIAGTAACGILATMRFSGPCVSAYDTDAPDETKSTGGPGRQFEHYAFEAFKPELTDRLPQLVSLLSEHGLGEPDRKRSGFYNLQDEEHWYYVHVQEALRKIYLVGYGQNESAQPSQWSDGCGNATGRDLDRATCAC